MSCPDRWIGRRHTRARVRLLVVVATFLALAACVGGAHGPDKAGGEGAPITLTLGTPDSDGHPDTPLIHYFAQQVDDISGGRLRIRIEYYAAGEAPDFDQVTVREVHDGSLDLGWVGSRVWDTEGVPGFQALQAPFLITNYRLLDRVLTGPIADDMLADLKQVGMVGLGLYPDELRHPVGLGAPLLSLADFRGAEIRVPASRASDALMRALGARPVHLNGSAMVQAIASGQLRGLESSTGNAVLSQGRPIVTGNVTFFPRPITLFAAADTLAALSDAQRDVLGTAARRTLDFALGRQPEAGSAARLCALGGAVVMANQADVADIERAGDAVYAELERDRQTRSFIAQIRRMKAAIGPRTTPPAPCGTVARGAPKGTSSP
jgi:TRAP-type C4-dicarboxylate transport system substrate-binding protein